MQSIKNKITNILALLPLHYKNDSNNVKFILIAHICQHFIRFYLSSKTLPVSGGFFIGYRISCLFDWLRRNVRQSSLIRAGIVGHYRRNIL